MIHKRGKGMETTNCPDGPFIPFATMFKLNGPDGNEVVCVACRVAFLLSDLLSGELEEDSCPKCHNHASVYWRRFRHRTVPTGS